MRDVRDLRFVVFGDDWGRHVSTMQHLLGRLTSRYEMVWINGIGHREPRLSADDLVSMGSRPACGAPAGTDGTEGTDCAVGAGG